MSVSIATYLLDCERGILTDLKDLHLLLLVRKLLNQAPEVTVVLGNTICMLVNVIENVGIAENFQKRHLATNERNKVVS